MTVRLCRRRRVCSRCGQTGPHLQIHDRRTKRWRHLDLGRTRCVIECELRRLRCPDCGVHLEAVGWARPDAHHTRDFEDVTAKLQISVSTEWHVVLFGPFSDTSASSGDSPLRFASFAILMSAS